MRRYYQVAGFLILSFAVFVMVESRIDIDYYTEYGPGEGFLPFWCGVFLAAFSLAWLVQVSFRPVESIPPKFYPDRKGGTRVLSAIGVLILFPVLMNLLGFQLAIIPFLFSLLLILGRQSLLSATALSIAGGWGLTYAFRNLLGVPLPMSAFDFLKTLGL